MRRVLISVTAVLVAGATLWDVYTLASDVLRPAPWWQLGLRLTDVSLLATVAGLVWRNAVGAHRVVLGDLIFVIGGACILVSRDGVTGFVHGFGVGEYLSLFLATLAIRIALYVALIPREAKPANEAHDGPLKL
jgi:hypothetical protein